MPARLLFLEGDQLIAFQFGGIRDKTSFRHNYKKWFNKVTQDFGCKDMQVDDWNSAAWTLLFGLNAKANLYMGIDQR